MGINNARLTLEKRRIESLIVGSLLIINKKIKNSYHKHYGRKFVIFTLCYKSKVPCNRYQYAVIYLHNLHIMMSLFAVFT